MSDTTEFDVVVIGAGPAGENAAGRLASHGLTVALVEHELVGGECSYWACIPSKSLLRPHAALAAARRVPGLESAITGTIDSAAVLAHRDEAVNFYNDSSQAEWVHSAGVTLLRGHGRLIGQRRVVVGGVDSELAITARRAVVLATGSLPVIPPIPGLDQLAIWDSRSATSAKEVPDHLAVLGGGVVAVEMAQAWRSLGSRVTLVVRGSGLLDREEPFAGEALLAAFAQDGIDVRLDTEVTQARPMAGCETGQAQLSVSDGSLICADRVLVATGRRPATQNLGLEHVGLDPTTPVAVDDRLAAFNVDGDWLYAIGDVNGRALLTHMGKYQARLAADGIVGRPVQAWADNHAITRVIFTDPQVAAVGLTAAQATRQGLRIREVRVRLSSAAGASLLGRGVDGIAQIVVDEDRLVIVGATLTGPEVGEMLHAATIAIVGEVPLERLWHAVAAFPTVSEIWLRLLEAYGL